MYKTLSTAAALLIFTVTNLTALQAGNVIRYIDGGNEDPVVTSFDAADQLAPEPPNSFDYDGYDTCDGPCCSDVGGCECDGCGDCCGCYCRKPNLFGPIAASDPRFSGFISPMTNPVFFEDPRTLTEARLIFLRHKFPLATGGGSVRLLALQVRAALTERLSIIATKDGFIMSDNPLINDGWGDINAGLKYVLFADPQSQRILSAGVTYELPVGSTRSLQGNGDGMFALFMSGGAKFCAWHWMTTSGFLLPTDTAAESQIWYWSNHIDRRLGCSNFYWVGEMNWYHYMRAGRAGIPGVEGGDLFNFGSSGVAGNDIVTGAVGLKFKPNAGMEIGVAWEAPLTDRRDVLDNRLTVDWIFRY